MRRETSSVTRPTARVLALLELLQSSPRTRTAAELAGRLGVDERTVRRYVAHLVELGVPVVSVRGPHGGVRLGPGHRMPPLMLTEEEALVVLLGVLAGRRAGVVAAASGVVDGAVAKLRRVLPVAVAQRLDGVLADADTDPTDAVARDTVRADVLLTLTRAAQEQRAVTLTHESADGRRTRRTVRPRGVVARAGHWYLSAVDADRGRLRTFRVDRVTGAELTHDRFAADPGAAPAEEVAAALDRVAWRHAVSLRVRGTAAEVADAFPAGLVTVDDGHAPDGWVRVALRAERLDWVPGLLAALPLPVVVEGPEELRELVRSLAGRLAAAADPPPGDGPPTTG